MITIIDYGVGNIGSILNMFNYLNIQANVHSNPSEILRAQKIILPGVGSFDSAVNKLRNVGGLTEALQELVINEQKEILGVCLGMQLLTERSEEGTSKGLGLIKGITKKFVAQDNFKVPHVGWNSLQSRKLGHPIFNNLGKNARFYFSHSYFVDLKDQDDALTETFYGTNFTSSFARKNVYGVQFHPERSHKYGLQFYKNFAEL
jgi:glutamine amidotransferase